MQFFICQYDHLLQLCIIGYCIIGLTLKSKNWKVQCICINKKKQLKSIITFIANIINRNISYDGNNNATTNKTKLIIIIIIEIYKYNIIIL